VRRPLAGVAAHADRQSHFTGCFTPTTLEAPMLRSSLLAITVLCCTPLSVFAGPTSVDMGSPLPPRPIPVREKNKKQARDGQDSRSGDDAKVKTPPKDPSADKSVDK